MVFGYEKHFNGHSSTQPTERPEDKAEAEA